MMMMKQWKIQKMNRFVRNQDVDLMTKKISLVAAHDFFSRAKKQQKSAD